jgi:prepilin-type processing-associated H-X9-DG protein
LKKLRLGASPVTPPATSEAPGEASTSLFDPKRAERVKIAEITDGTSNTIAVVEAKEGVPWTKPEGEIAVDDDPKPERIKAALEAVGGHFDGGFNTLFCDGSARFIRTTVALPVLRAIITRCSGEVISSDSFRSRLEPKKTRSFCLGSAHRTHAPGDAIAGISRYRFAFIEFIDYSLRDRPALLLRCVSGN